MTGMFKVEDGFMKVEKCDIKFSEPDCKKARQDGHGFYKLFKTCFFLKIISFYSLKSFA